MSDVAAKVAALLRKAESTEFPDEADALTAKAHALMAKHRIDAAMVAATTGIVSGGGIVRHAFGITGSYGPRKVALAHAVARATGCQAVSADYGAANKAAAGWRYGLEVFGTQDDVSWCESLYNSLVTQMDDRIARDTKRLGYAGGTGRRYGTSFVMGFTAEVTERLKAVNAAAQQEAQSAAPGSPSVAVVLASKAKRVEDELARVYPDLGVRKQSAVTSYEGVQAGREAGASATIARGSVAPSTRKAIG